MTDDSARTAAVVSFTTDYGIADAYVGICHGVIARIAPRARVIDVSHGVPLGSVAAGSYLLASAVPYLPAGVHLAVVDPGVGTDRRAVILRAGDSLLVGPDNGLLLPAADALGGASRAYQAVDARFRLHPVSATFHGRDIFAPAAAHLAAGAAPEEFGPVVEPASLVRLPVSPVRMTDGILEGQVAHVDTYGNLILTIPAGRLPPMGVTDQDLLAVTVAERTLPARRGRTFADVPAGELVVHADSGGRLAIAVNCGSASRAFGGIPEDASVLIKRLPSGAG
jgi:S-adenosylmethionine hydrolase